MRKSGKRGEEVSSMNRVRPKINSEESGRPGSAAEEVSRRVIFIATVRAERVDGVVKQVAEGLKGAALSGAQLREGGDPMAREGGLRLMDLRRTGAEDAVWIAIQIVYCDRDGRRMEISQNVFEISLGRRVIAKERSDRREMLRRKRLAKRTRADGSRDDRSRRMTSLQRLG